MEKRFPHTRHHDSKRLLTVAIVALAAYLLIISTGFGPYITDHFSFRQTQTAITARYFSGAADFLSYATPVLGPPWSIPFEFPLYQALAKGLHVASGLTLETSGRLVSVAFFLMCFWPLHLLLRAFGVDSTMVVMMPVLLAPLYVFWSRSFMIETTALFFSLLFLSLFAKSLQEGRCGSARLLVLTLAGVLAALIKLTTLAPVLLATMVATAWLALRPPCGVRAWRTTAALAISHAIVLAAAFAWVRHTDAVKHLNPLGDLLSSGALRNWNIGTLALRLDPQSWITLAGRTVDIFYPLPGLAYSRLLLMLKIVLFVAWLAVFVWSLYHCTTARRRQVGALCGLYLLPFLLFTNLHLVHSYYQAANAVFLCLAFGLAVCGALETAPDKRSARRRLALYAAALLSCGLTSLWYLHHRSSHEGSLIEISAVVRQMSAPDSVIVVSGLDWSSVLPYQASRRALMLPALATSAKASAALENLRRSGYVVSLYVACGEPTLLDRAAREVLAIGGAAPARHVDRCAIHRL